MQWTPLTRRHRKPPPQTPARAQAVPTYPVYFDARAKTYASAVAAPLYPVDDLAQARVAVLLTHAAVVARLCERHPGLRVLAIVPVGRDQGGSGLASGLLMAGAEGCLIQPSAAEVAARLRALARRDGVFSRNVESPLGPTSPISP